MRIIYGFLAFICVLLLVLPVAVPVIKTSAEFSMFNTKWNGCSEFAKCLAREGKVIPVLYPYNSIHLGDLDGALIIIGPDVDFSSLEANEVKKFLERGGTIFIADDFGKANSLLEKLNVKARFSNQRLKDIFYSKRIEFPVVIRIEDPDLASGVKRLVLNVPSVITGADGEIFSSKVSVVGRSMRSFPILAELRYGQGRIIMLSDPSVLINDMFEENRVFIENLIRYIKSDRFYFDEVHHSDFNPYTTATVYIHRELDREKAFQIFVMISILAVFIESGIAKRILNTISRLIPRREEELLKGLPEWVDIKTLERIINEIKTGSKIGDRYGRKGVLREIERRGE